MMGEWYRLSHTSDIGFHIEANGMSDLFETLLEAIKDTIFEKVPFCENFKRTKILLKGSKSEEIFLDFLREVIFLIYFKKEMPHKILAVDKLSEKTKIAYTYYNLEPFSDLIITELKSPTYHGYQFYETKNFYKVDVVIDV